MPNNRRCSECREYFRPDLMFKGSGIQAFCTKECMRSHVNKTRTKRKDSGVPGPTRKLLFERFRHMCAYCGRSGRGLQAHHIKYRSEGVDHSLNNLILLCAEHHDMVHSDKKKWQPLLREFIANIESDKVRAYGTLALVEKDWDRERSL